MSCAIEVAPAGSHILGIVGRWVVKQQGTGVHFGTFWLKKNAVAHGRVVSRTFGCEFVIKGRDGRIQSKDSHGGDPPEVHG